MGYSLWVAGIVDGRSRLNRQTDLLVELPDRKQPCVAGQLRLLRRDKTGLGVEKIERHVPIRPDNHLRAYLVRTS